MRAAILVLLVAALGVSVSGSSAAPTWNSNTFRSPDGQVKCRYFADDNAITCYTGHYVLANLHPSSYWGWYAIVSQMPFVGPGLPISARAAVLRYGQTWSTDGRRKTIACTATRRSPAIVGPGITCRGYVGTVTHHGFRLSAWGNRKW
jgi:hypothetical protein